MRSLLLACGMVAITSAPSPADTLEILETRVDAGTRRVHVVVAGGAEGGSLNPAGYVLREEGDVQGVMATHVEPYGVHRPNATTFVVEDRGDVDQILAQAVASPTLQQDVDNLRLVTYGPKDVVECRVEVLDQLSLVKVLRRDCRSHPAGRGVLAAIQLAATELASFPHRDRRLLVIGTSGPLDRAAAHAVRQQTSQASISTNAIVYRAEGEDSLHLAIPRVRYAETLDEVSAAAVGARIGAQERTVRVTFPTFEPATGYALPWDGVARTYRLTTFDDGEAMTTLALPDRRMPAPSWPYALALGGTLGGLGLGFWAGRRRAAARVARLA